MRDHYSNSSVIGGLVPGDAVWFVTSGESLGREEKRAGFLVGIGKVAGVAENPGDAPKHTRDDYRYTNAERVLPAREEYTRCVYRLKLSHLVGRTIPPGFERKHSLEW